MVIDKIGNINNIVEPKGAKATPRSRETGKTDQVEISSEGKKAAEFSRYAQVVKDTPDIRQEKVREIKARIQDGTYDKFNDDQVLQMVADRIATYLLRK